MIITELIRSLNAGLKQYGDVEVTYFNPDISKTNFYSIKGIGYNQFTKEINIFNRYYPDSTYGDF